MKYKLTQAELCEAVEQYLNKTVLSRPVRISTVIQVTHPAHRKGSDVALEVEATDDQSQVEKTDATLPDGNDNESD